MESGYVVDTSNDEALARELAKSYGSDGFSMESILCPICGKELNKYDPAQRNLHVSECSDKVPTLPCEAPKRRKLNSASHTPTTKNAYSHLIELLSKCKDVEKLKENYDCVEAEKTKETIEIVINKLIDEQNNLLELMENHNKPEQTVSDTQNIKDFQNVIDSIAESDKENVFPLTQPFPKSKFQNQDDDLPTYIKPSDL